MKTLNKNTKLTNSEVEIFEGLFSQGIKIYRKVKLYGSGHPQLADFFGTNMSEAEEEEFWADHETTHARFIEYNSLDDMAADEHLWRIDLVSEGFEISEYDLPIYQ